MSLVEDYAPFLADFGTDAVIGGASVRGIFDNGYASAFGDVAGSLPTLLLPTTSVGLAVPGDAITVGGTSYTIAESQPDGTGMSRLVLQA